MKIFALIMLVIQLGINPETTEIYPMTSQIVGFDYEMNLVTVVDFGSEECFQFYGIEDWQVGDVVSLIMSNNGTPEIYDDMILDCRYTGITMEIPEAMQDMTIYPYPDEYPILTCGE